MEPASPNEILQGFLQGFPALAPQAFLLSYVLMLGVLALASWLAHFMTRKILVNALTFAVKKSKNNFDDILLKHRVFNWIAHVSPALVIYLYAGALPLLSQWMQRLSIAYITVICIITLNVFLNSVTEYYQSLEISARRPIKGYIQVIKIIVVALGVIFFIAVLLDKSPWGFLSGLGAMSAILLLVFKDSLLGLAAGIQLSSNKMVNVGDWIEMPKYGADGNVIDIALTTVKVQNWDKTISTVPTYALVSDSFKNWRGMSESGGRRIKRAIFIDVNTIKFCDKTLLDKFSEIEILKEYLEAKKTEIASDRSRLNIAGKLPINARRLTNLGTFRAYVIAYLKEHPKIHNHMTFLVRQLAPTEHGLPLEIYVFANDSAWVNYEGIQADIFDHLFAALPEFELRAFQNPAGTDFQRLSQTP